MWMSGPTPKWAMPWTGSMPSRALTTQPGHLIEQRGCLDLSMSHWVRELDVDDLKFLGDARNSRNHYTTTPMISNSCVHELASSRRLALANATRIQARMKNQQSGYLLKLRSHKSMNGEIVFTV
jgi:hypothetical protein